MAADLEGRQGKRCDNDIASWVAEWVFESWDSRSQLWEDRC